LWQRLSGVAQYPLAILASGLLTPDSLGNSISSASYSTICRCTASKARHSGVFSLSRDTSAAPRRLLRQGHRRASGVRKRFAHASANPFYHT
jgi:hypothetical protein